MSQRIVRLAVENILRLKAIDLTIDPKKPLILVRGKNGNGKSSLIDAIAFVIGGKRLQPPEVIRRGETYARALLETEELIVERKWKVSDDEEKKVTDTVEVRSKEGAKFKSPQTMLDGLISRLSFDPLHFLSLDPKEQAEALRRIVGLDFRLLDGKRLKAYDDRTTAKRDLENLKKRYEVHPPGVTGAAPIDVAELLAQQAILQSRARVAGVDAARLTSATSARQTAEVAVREAEAAMRKAYDRLKEAKAAEAAAQTAVDVSKPPDQSSIAEIATKIATASQHNEKVRQGIERAALWGQVEAQAAAVAGLEEAVAEIDEEKQRLTAAAAFPVVGLGFGDVGVTFEGFPFEQASGAARIRVSTGIGFALHPQLKVLRIKDGSLLDNENLKLIEQLAEAADGQVWVEVRSLDPVGVVIEDGIVLNDGEVYSQDGVRVGGAA